MPVNLRLDNRLIEEAMDLGGHATREEAVTKALERYIRYQKQLRIRELFGKVNYDTDYGYKKHRTR